ncbi:BA75_01380T0 [Komagataella pastoris]|uniref:BA75_01380T0 n=1 Tax=Komagataella pastoris TaxID=4922 RepID=A0A1B2J801_PICPA|nr:BA75_01380T0 [Komagataella pastoris]
MQYRSLFLGSALLAAANAAVYNTTVTDVVSELETTVLTITSCEEDKCITSKSTGLITTSTLTKHGVVTVVTTVCDLPSTTKSYVPPAKTTIVPPPAKTTTVPPPAKTTTTVPPPAKTSSHGESTITVTVPSTTSTKKIETESTTYHFVTQTTTARNVTPPAITTQSHGAAGMNAANFVGLGAAAVAAAALVL